MYVYILWKKKKVVVQTQLTFETCQMRWYQTDITTYLLKSLLLYRYHNTKQFVIDRSVNGICWLYIFNRYHTFTIIVVHKFFFSSKHRSSGICFNTIQFYLILIEWPRLINFLLVNVTNKHRKGQLAFFTMIAFLNNSHNTFISCCSDYLIRLNFCGWMHMYLHFISPELYSF